MLKRIGLIGLTSAALTFVFVACGDDVLPEAGCTTDADCDTTKNEICHPQAQVCVQGCTTSNDCPNSAKTCEAISATDSTLICKCSTDALCAAENAGFVCSDAFEVCLNSCSSNADCGTGFTCDTTTGECVSGGGGGDAGMCSWDTCSTAEWTGAAGQQCTATGCGAGPSCSGTGQSSCDVRLLLRPGGLWIPTVPDPDGLPELLRGWPLRRPDLESRPAAMVL